MVGAISLSNNKVLVAFSKPMSLASFTAANFSITHSNSLGVSGLTIVSARMASLAKTAVELTTLSQSEVNYTVAVANVYDLGGLPLSSPFVQSGVLVDPSRATFTGKAPSLTDLVDADQDGLNDNEEQRGWRVTVKLLNGNTSQRWVSSDPLVADSDADGLFDYDEHKLGLDPRTSTRTAIRSATIPSTTRFTPTPRAWTPTATDSMIPWNSLSITRRPPIRTRTATRSRTTSRPCWEIAICASPTFPGPASRSERCCCISMCTRLSPIKRARPVLKAKSAQSTLSQTESESSSNTDSDSQEFSVKVGYEKGWSTKAGVEGVGASGKFSIQGSTTNSWSSSFTEESAKETQKAIAKTFATEREATLQETVEREIAGATMKVGLNLKSMSNIAFTIKNLQITAFIQDPSQFGKLIPIATLLPDNEPDEGFTLGPQVPERGPFVFSNDTIFASLVQELMLNPQGLVFRISNYDIVDERGRNFAFSSQDINDRTAPLVIDFGFGDITTPGVGGTTERYRVSTSGGRACRYEWRQPG